MAFERLKQKLHLGRSKPTPTPAVAREGAGTRSKTQASESKPGASAATTSQPQAPSKPAFVFSEASDARPIRELWNIAYEKLREEDGELVQQYEADLLRPGDLMTSLGSIIGERANKRVLMDAALKRKVEEVQRDAWKLKFGGSAVPVKDLTEDVLRVVGWANDYITNAASGNACTSIAWFGVSLLLPVGCPPVLISRVLLWYRQ
jgi:hypothetical protein